MAEKILIWGSGQIGTLYKNYFDSKKVDAQITAEDITDKTKIADALDALQPTVVINTAAKTNLEWCAQNKLDTFNANVLGPDNLAEACDKRGIYFVHLSSGCIFQSKNAQDRKKEDDIPAPSAFYSFTKAWAEQIIALNRSADFKYLILRPRQPISTEFNYKNMLVKILTFSKFIDTPNAVTILEDLMGWTEKLVGIRARGTVNASNDGWTTPYQIGLLLKKHILPELEVNKITKDELDKLMPNRRVDTVLDISKLRGLVEKVDSIDTRLEDVVIKLGENLRKMPKEEIRRQLDKTLEQSRKRTVVNDKWEQLISMGK